MKKESKPSKLCGICGETTTDYEIEDNMPKCKGCKKNEN